jgi:hypothetical protein
MIGRRSLQIATGILAIIPVVTGLIGLSGISDPLYSIAIQNVLLDSNLRAALYPMAGSRGPGG